MKTVTPNVPDTTCLLLSKKVSRPQTPSYIVSLWHRIEYTALRLYEESVQKDDRNSVNDE